MNKPDLEQLTKLTCAFYKEAKVSSEQDCCGAFLDLVNERAAQKVRARADKARQLREHADTAWQSGNKALSTALHDEARELEL